MTREHDWQEIASIDAETPPDKKWEAVFGNLTSSDNALKTTDPTKLSLHASPPGWRDVRVAARLRTGDGMVVQMDTYLFELGYWAGPGLCIRLLQRPLAVTGRFHLDPQREQEVVCERVGGRVRILIDGECVLEADDPHADLGVLYVSPELPADSSLRHLRVEGRPAPGEIRPFRPVEKYHLYATIDFYDDLIKNTWTRRTFRDLMALYKKNRVRRVYFIYHYGYDSGFWRQPGRRAQFPGFQEHIDRTYENVGDFLPAAVEAAHAADLPFFAVLKPFETALYGTFPEGSEKAKQYGRIPRLGGPIWWSPDFTAENPHLRIERDVSDVPPDLDERVVGTIVLRGEPGLGKGFDPSRLRLWVSANNGRYEAYAGPIETRVEHDEGMRVILDGLNIPQRFFAVTIDGDPANTFGNRLRHLVEVRDARGEKLPITFSNQVWNRKDDFRESGFMVDVPYHNAVGGLDEFHWVDGALPLGMALGRIAHLQGALCPGYREVQAWWMEQADKCLAAGVDGIDFRIVNHNRTFDWDAYGFNAPTVEAFRERYGVDMMREPFDREAWRRLRGERYTEFLRAASWRLRERGKAVHAHVSHRMGPSSWHTEMNIHFDWETWIQEGLLDEVTLKTSSVRSHPAAYALAMAHDGGLKGNYCPYVNGLPKRPDGDRIMERQIREAREGGVDGLILYENAAFVAATDDGGVEVTCPYILEMAAKYAK